MGITHSADMNDICTTLDPNYEPKFQVAPVGPYTDELKKLLRTHYPNITPFYFQDAPKDTYDAIKVVIGHEKGWKIKHESEDELLVEFEATTSLMKFTDDVVVQVKPWGPAGSVVNMRSRSRVGAGDWGANYKRMCYINSRAALHHAKAPAGMEVKNYADQNAPATDAQTKVSSKKSSKAKLDKKVSSVSGKSSEDSAPTATKEKTDDEPKGDNTLTGSQSSAPAEGKSPREKKSKSKSKSKTPRDGDSAADPAPSAPSTADDQVPESVDIVNLTQD